MMHEYKESPIFDESMRFGEIVRKKRRLMGFNQKDFAEYIGVDPSTISLWELEKTSPTIEKARYIFKLLGFELITREK